MLNCKFKLDKRSTLKRNVLSVQDTEKTLWLPNGATEKVASLIPDIIQQK